MYVRMIHLNCISSNLPLVIWFCASWQTLFRSSSEISLSKWLDQAIIILYRRETVCEMSSSRCNIKCIFWFLIQWFFNKHKNNKNVKYSAELIIAILYEYRGYIKWKRLEMIRKLLNLNYVRYLTLPIQTKILFQSLFDIYVILIHPSTFQMIRSGWLLISNMVVISADPWFVFSRWKNRCKISQVKILEPLASQVSSL